MAQYYITLTEEHLHGLFVSNGRDEAFAKLLEEIFNQVLLAQSTEQLQAAPYERTEKRTAYRNGSYDRSLTTRVGTLRLHIPRHRNGDFSTELFQRYQRSEQALILAMMEMVVNGVSTRKVEFITEELCEKKFSKSTVSALCEKLDPLVHDFRTRPWDSHYPFMLVDAIYLKVRIGNKVKSRGLLVAIGVNEEGYREIITEQLCEKQCGKTTVSVLCEKLDPIVHDFRTRPLDSHYPFMLVDAIYLKVRIGNRVQSRGLLFVIGVYEEGYREIIGLQVA